MRRWCGGLPWLGKRPIAAIESPELLAVLRKVEVRHLRLDLAVCPRVWAYLRFSPAQVSHKNLECPTTGPGWNAHPIGILPTNPAQFWPIWEGSPSS
ncbi:MAG: hypothetical protein NZ482_08015 [Gloeomargarita sp. SKYG98]|nr:hypothetical protein [Gloeomargarita sp. SKYG98]